MAVIQEEMGPNGPNMMMFGPGAQGNAGDYVMTQRKLLAAGMDKKVIGANTVRGLR